MHRYPLSQASDALEAESLRPGVWRRLAAATMVAGLLTIPAQAREANALDDIVVAIDAGRFEAAQARIARMLGDGAADAATKRELEFQRERMRRIRLDFPMTEVQVKQRLLERIPDLRDDEFQAWKSSGQLEHLVIDGEPAYFARSVSNLFLLNPQAAARRAPPVKPPIVGPMERPHAYHAEAVAEARATGRRHVAPRRVRVTQSLTVARDAVRAGEVLRAWIPVPRVIPGQQSSFRVVASTPKTHRLASASTLQRTAYFEQAAKPGVPTRFSITYELTVHGQVNRIDGDSVRPLDAATARRPDIAPHLGERLPHIAFTDDLRAFSRKVVGEETNPYRIARLLFEAVDRIPWAGAREYSTLTNISDYALRAGHADCGQQTLLLMTLLRLNGIPARWQSGMVFSDGDYDNLHDWGWMYLAPHGWVPMDVTTGRFANVDDPAVEWFYLGGLDAYRIAFNDDYGAPFVPAKTHFRSDTVDSQRGEVEWRGGNLYFDQWDYTFEAQVLPQSKPGA